MRAFAVGVLLAVVACSARDGRENTGSTRSAIQGGQTDTVDTYAVGVCRNATRPNGQPVAPGHCLDYCSGTLILPNVVATARHCVSQAEDEVDCTTGPTFGADIAGPLWVTTNATMDATVANAGWYEVAATRVPADAHICGNDIALLVLKDAVPAGVATPAIPGVQYSIWDPDEYGPIFTAVGYGNVSTTSGDGLGTRRKLEGIDVVCVPGSNTVCAQPFSDDEFIGGDGTCAGDSGSSAFEQTSYARNAPVALGVLSRGGADGTRCVGSIYTRFDTKRDFVLEVAREASGGFTLYPEPSWTEPKPAAVPRARDAGVIDASVPDASLCAGGSCVEDAGITTESSDGGCSVSGRSSRAEGAMLVLAYLLIRSARNGARRGGIGSRGHRHAAHPGTRRLRSRILRGTR